MVTMADKIFIDTNIIVYADSKDDNFSAIARETLKSYADKGYQLYISRQVIREYLVITSRKMILSKNYDSKRLVARIKQFDEYFIVADDDKLVTDKLLELIDKYQIKGKQIHDTSIVATVIVNNIDHLLTNNINDFKKYNEDFNLIPLLP